MEYIKDIGSTFSAIFLNFLVYKLFMVLAGLMVMLIFGAELYTTDHISFGKLLFVFIQMSLLIYAFVKRVLIQSVWGLIICLSSLISFQFLLPLI